MPKLITITSEEVREALIEPLENIINIVKITLEKTPPELASDIIEKGIMIAGGGALLRGFAHLLSRETKVPVHTACDPLECVVKGTKLVLENTDKWKNTLISSKELA